MISLSQLDVRALSDAIASLVFAAAIGSFLAGWLGAFYGRVTYNFRDWFVLRRLRSWRRYQRAMGRLFS